MFQSTSNCSQFASELFKLAIDQTTTTTTTDRNKFDRRVAFDEDEPPLVLMMMMMMRRKRNLTLRNSSLDLDVNVRDPIDVDDNVIEVAIPLCPSIGHPNSRFIFVARQNFRQPEKNRERWQ